MPEGYEYANSNQETRLEYIKGQTVTVNVPVKEKATQISITLRDGQDVIGVFTATLGEDEGFVDNGDGTYTFTYKGQGLGDNYTYTGGERQYTVNKHQHRRVILRDVFEPRDLTLSFETNGGSEISPITVKYNRNLRSVDLPEPIRPGYKFLGWYEDQALSKKLNVHLKVKEDKTLYAKWEKLPNQISLGAENVDRVTITADGVEVPVSAEGTAKVKAGQEVVITAQESFAADDGKTLVFDEVVSNKLCKVLCKTL